MIKNTRKWIALVLVIMMTVLLLAACGGGNGGGSNGGGAPVTAPATIKIGIPNSSTGGTAVFGIGTPATEMLIQDYVNNELGGIYIEEYDKKIPIECIFVDTESSETKTAELTQQLITNNGIDILLAHTPVTALPASAMAENLSTPFVSLVCPVELWLTGGPYEWGYLGFWSLEEVCEIYMAIWEGLGYMPNTGVAVGAIFPDDPDGNAWAPIFRKMVPERGYIYVDPGPTEMVQADWTSVINTFKQGGVKIITGIPITIDMANFCTQSIQQGFEFEIATTGRGTLFPNGIETFPEELIEKFYGEIWWSPYHPWVSDLTGMTCPELGSWWEEVVGEPWAQPIGYKYAGMEIVVDALTRAASLDPEKIRDAIAATDLNTVVGHIKFDQDTHIANTPVVGGSWSMAGNKPDGSPIAEFDIVYNATWPAIPLTAELELPKGRN